MFDSDESGTTVCVSRWWAGVDNAWEQEKPEARKMPVSRDESHQSAARCVGRFRLAQDLLAEKDNTVNATRFYMQPNFWQ
jgi:hypothetical protein